MTTIIEDFKNNLKANQVSRNTVKSYVSDLYNLETYLVGHLREKSLPVANLNDCLNFMDADSILSYKESLINSNVPNPTVNRRLSTVRKFTKYLTYQGLTASDFSNLVTNIQSQKSVIVEPNINTAKAIEDFTNYLSKENSSANTIKNYLSDARRFFASPYASSKQISHITTNDIKAYPCSKRALYALHKFFTFALEKGIVSYNPVSEVLFPVPLSTKVSRRLTSLPIYARIAGNTKIATLFGSYKGRMVSKFVGLAALLLLATASGIGVYEQFFAKSDSSEAYTTTGVKTPKRYLSFQGRLLDEFSTPVTTTKSTTFKLYSVDTGGVALWTGTCDITPDQDGIFSTLLGSGCGTEIDASVFSENTQVWLGVEVDSDGEADPRVQIATVGYALNSETVQGYPIDATGSATRNSIVTMNNGGEIIIAESSPTMKSVSGTFAIEGQAITLRAPDTSNGSININPDGTGTLNLTFEGAAPGGSALGFVNAVNAGITSGSLYYGEAATDATGFNLITLASGSSPTTKFSVDDAGNTSLATGADLSIGGIGLNDNGTSSSGASLIGLYDDDMSYISPGSTTVQDAIKQLDTALIGIGSSGITGTGTSNYLPKWNTATSLTNSLVYDDGTNVGIGITVPTAKLQVLGTIKSKNNIIITDNNAFLFGTTSGAVEHRMIGLNNSNQLQIGEASNSVPLRFDAGGASRMYINTSGNVGIGTSSPKTKLDVNGLIQTSRQYETTTPQGVRIGSAYGGSLYLQYMADSSVKSYIFQNAFLTSPGGTETYKWDMTSGSFGSRGIVFSYGTTSNKGIIFYADSAATTAEGTFTPTQRMIIQNDGNVGIGTTSPSVKLDVNGTVQSTTLYLTTAAYYITSDTPNGIIARSDGGINLRTGGNNTRLNINSSGDFIFNTNQLYIKNSTGNVGIGTTTPGYKLDVAGDIQIATGSELYSNGSATLGDRQYSANNYVADAETFTASIDALDLALAGISSSSITGTGTDNYIPRWNGTTALENSSIYDSGTGVGIGTTLPIGRLNLVNTSRDNILKIQSRGNTGDLAGVMFKTYSNSLGDDYYNTGLVMEDSGTGIGRLHLIMGSGAANATVADSALTVNTNKNIGLGTTVPGTKLSVAGGVGIGTTDSFANAAIAANSLAVQGNIGVGTTSPSYRMHIKQNAYTTPATQSTYGFTLDSLATGSLSIGADSNFAYIQSFNSTPLQINNAGNNTLINVNSGLVGIGTTSPSVKLTVAGSGSEDVLNILDGTTSALFVDKAAYVGIGITAPYRKLTVSGTMGVTGNIYHEDGDFYFYGANHKMVLYDDKILGFGGSNGTQDVSMGWNSADDSLRIASGTDLTTTSWLTAKAGNIGIGTTVPGYKLDVNGDIEIASGSELYSNGSATLGNRTYTNDYYVTDAQTFTASIDALDIAVAGIGASGITGTGTSNYLPKWNTTTSLTNSLVYDNGTGVGIGTTVPAQLLQVNGGSIISAKAQYTLNGTAYGNQIGSGDSKYTSSIIGYSGGGAATLKADPLGETHLYVGLTGFGYMNTSGGARSIGVYGYALQDNPNLVNGNDGQIGGYFLGEIGTGTTNNHGYTYGVYGKADTTMASSQNGGELYGVYGYAIGQTNNTVYGGRFVASGGTTNYGVYTTGTQYGIYSAQGANYFNGNVGIGTTDINYKLDVNSATSDSVARFTSTDDLAQILVSDIDTTGYFGAKDSRAFIGTSSGLLNTNLVIDETGKVGIGVTANGNYKLYVAGVLRATSSYSPSWDGDGLFGANALPSVIATPGGEEIRFGYFDDGAGSYVPRMGFYQTTNGGIIGANNSFGNTVQGDLTINVGTSNTERMRFTLGGYTGIGTTSPQSKLDVEGGAVIGATYSGTSVAPSNGLLVQGNVGIGMTLPGTLIEAYKDLGRSTLTGTSKGLLHLNAGLNDITTLTMGEASSDAGIPVSIIGSYQNASAGSSLFFGTSNSFGSGITNTALWINPSGNIGIGTTTPLSALDVRTGNVGIGTTMAATQKLDVQGNARITGAIYDSNNEAGSNTKVLSSTAGGAIDWIDLSAVGVSGTGTANYLPKWSDTAVLTNSMLYENVTGIGIGTTVPNTKLSLSVSGGASITSAITNSAIRIKDTNNGANAKYGISWETGDSGQNYTIAAIEPEVIAGWDTHLNFYTRQGGTLVNALHLNEAGRVGIGTTTPKSTLDVEGGVVIGATYSGTSVAPTNGLIVQGNVGIGITAPTQKLDVSGNANLSGTGSLMFGGYNVLTSTSAGGNVTLRSSGGDLIFTNASTAERMRINSVGNVGIGTSLPLNALHIKADMGAGPNYGQIKIEPVSNDQASSVYLTSTYTATDRTWFFGTGDGAGGANTTNFRIVDVTAGNKDRLNIDSNGNVNLAYNGGNVGIGTTSPLSALDVRTGNVGIGTTMAATQKLDVQGNARITGAIYDSNNEAGSNTKVLSSTAGGAIDWIDLSAVGVSGTGTANYLPKWSAGSVLTNSMLYENATGIGIGVTSVGSTLPSGWESHADSRILEINSMVAGRDTGVFIRRGSGATGLDLWSDGSNGDVFIDSRFDDSNGDIFIRTRTAGTPVNALTILGGTKVGVGTSTPQSRLDVEGGAAIGAAYSGTSVAPTNGLIVEGNVGIGTTSPGYRLSVNGDIQIATGSELYSNGSATLGNRQYTNDNYVTDGQTYTASIDALDLALAGVSSSGVTGTGTDNYIPRWNGTTALENSLIYDNGTNIGIGTTTPSYQVSLGNGLGDKLAVYDNGSNTIYGFGIRSGQIYVKANNVEAATFTSDGRLGVGTSTPANKLSVSGGVGIGGTAYTTNAAPTNGLIVNGNVGIGVTSPAEKLVVTGNIKLNGNGDSLRDYNSNNLISNASNLVTIGNAAVSQSFQAGATSTFSFKRSTTTDLYISSSGQLGVATTTPGYQLDVNGDINIATGSELYSNGSATLGNRTYTSDNYVTDAQTFTASIDALDIAVAGIGASGITGTGTSNYLPKWNTATSLTNSLVYDDGTNVGIGITVPTAKLQVLGTIKSKNNIIITDNNAFLFGTTSGAVEHRMIGLNNSNQLQIGEASNSVPLRFDAGGASRMYINTSGNVGIGTSLPQASLHVATGQILAPAGTQALPGLAFDGDGDTGIFNYSSGTIIFSTNNAQGYVMDSTSFRGGSNSSGTASLRRLVGSATVPSFYFGSDGDTGLGWTAENVMSFISGGTNMMNLSSTGLGIGTTSPQYSLQTTGDLQVTGAIRDTSADAGTASQILTSTGTGTNWVDITSIGVSGTGTANYLPKWSDTAVLTNSLLFEDGTNVGIGTTTPQNALDVNGNIRTTFNRSLPTLLLDSTASGEIYTDQGARISLGEGVDSEGAAQLSITYTGDGYGYIGSGVLTNGVPGLGYISFKWNTDDIYAKGDLGVGVAVPVNKLDVEGGAVIGATYSGTSVSPTNGLLVEGNVGIGTSNPTVPLEVNGVVKIGGSITFNGNAGSQIRSDSTGLISILNGAGNAYGNIQVGNGSASLPSFTFGNDTDTGLYSANSNTELGIAVGGSDRIRINASGNIGLGTTLPGDKLQLATGSVRIDSLNASTAVYTDANKSLTTTAPTSGTIGYWQRNGTQLSPATITDSIAVGTTVSSTAVAYIPGTTNNNAWFNLGTGNLGVGTTAPGAKLSFQTATTAAGGIDFGGDVNLYRSAADTLRTDDIIYTNQYLTTNQGIYFGSSVDTYLYRAADGLLSMGTGDSFTVRSGNLGVGTTSPKTALGIAGGVGIGTTDSFANAAIATNNLAVQGSVGIGTTSPTDKLQLASGSVRIDSLDASTAVYTDANKSLTTTAPTSGTIGYWQRNGTVISPATITDSIAVGTTVSSTAVAYIPGATNNNAWFNLGTGNLGVGTTVPSSKLTVIGANTSFTNTSASDFNMYIQGGEGSSANINIRADDGDDSADITTLKQSDGGLFQILTTNTTVAALNILANGNIGIGTTSPLAKLDVAGDVRIGTATTMADNNSVVSLDSGIVKTIDTTAWVKVGLKDLVAGSGLTGSADDVLVGTDSDVTLAIGAGNGISVAADAVAVNEDYAFNWTNSHTWTLAGTETLLMTNTGTGLSLKVEDEATDTTPFVIDVSGNVGIGVTATDKKLDIAGDMRLTGAFHDTSGDAGTAGQIMTSTATGTNWVNIGSIGVSGTGTANYLPKWSTDSALTDSLLFDDGTNIGIGTTTPSKKLDIAGDVNISTGSAYYINGVSVLNATTLGSNVVTSSLTTVGVLASGSITSGFGVISTGTTITTTGTMGTAGTTDFTGEVMTLTSNLNLVAPSNLAIGTTTLAETTAANDSGAYLVGVYDEFSYSSATTVQGVLNDIDAQLGVATSSAGGWTDDGDVVRLATIGDKVGIGVTSVMADLHIGTGTTSHSLDGDNDLFVVGDVEIDGTTYLDGNLTIGNASGDTVTVNSTAWTLNNDLNMDANTFFVDVSTDRVGLGLTNPSYKLDVNGDIKIAAGSDLYLGTIAIGNTTPANNTSSGASKIGVYDEFTYADPGTIQSVLNDLDLAMTTLSGSAGGWTDDGTVVRLTDSANDRVGIGITVPTSTLAVGTSNSTVEKFSVAGASGNTYIGGTLQVVSTSDFQGALSDSNSALQLNDDVDITGTLSDSNSNLVLADTVDLFDSSTGLRVGTDGQLTDIDDAAISIDDDITFLGAQAINTSSGDLTLSPAGNLVINTTGGTIDIDDATIDLTTQATTITLKSATVNALGIGGTALISLDTLNGRMGLGVTNPGFKLDVDGNVSFGLDENIEPDASGLLGQVLIDGNGYNGFVAIGSTAMRIGHNSGSRGLDLMTDKTSRLYITGDGNVGIGTTSPSYKLDVVGDIRIASGSDLYIGTIGLNDVGSSTTSGAYLVGLEDDSMTYITSDTTVQGAIKMLDNAVIGVSTTAAGWIHDVANNIVKLSTISDSVGIGTSSPQAQLHIGGGATSHTLSSSDLYITGELEVDASLYLDGGLNSSDGSQVLTVATDDAYFKGDVYVEDEVGIGLTNPSYNLDVNGNGRFTTNLYVLGSLYASGQLNYIGYGRDTTSLDTNLIFGDYAGAKYEQLLWDASESYFYFSDDLYVNGAATVAAVGTTDNPALKIGSTTGTMSIGQSGWYADGSYLSPIGTENFYIRATTPITYIYSPDIYLGNAIGDAVHVKSGDWTFENDTTIALSGGVNGLNIDSNTLSIDATNNRVGIGLTNIVYKLDVNGDMRAAGHLSTGSGNTISTSYIINNGEETSADRDVWGGIASVATVAVGTTVNTQYGAVIGARSNHQSADGVIDNMYGLYTYTNNTDTGDVTSMYGAWNRALNYTGDVTTARGTYSNIQLASSGTITNAYGVDILLDAAAGSGTTGVITNGYGLRIQDVEATTLSYGIYQSGANDDNYFAGNSGFGTSLPEVKLESYGTTWIRDVATDPNTGGIFSVVQNTIGTNGSMMYINTNDPATSNEFFVAMVSDLNGTPDNEVIITTTGAGYMDGSWSSPAADYAEIYKVTGDNVQPGDLVTIGEENPDYRTFTKSQGKKYDNKIMGIVSTNPGFKIGNSIEIEAQTDNQPIALSGRVPLKVSLENGTIRKGDPLTSSSTSGVAMKSTSAGRIIGYAMEDYDGTTQLSNGVVQVETERLNVDSGFNPIPAPEQGVGKIIAFVNVGYHDPTIQFADSGNIIIEKNLATAEYKATDAEGNTIDTIASFAKGIIANIQAGAVVASEISTDTLVAYSGEFVNTIKAGALEATSITSDTITTINAGFDYVAVTVGIRSPKVETATIATLPGEKDINVQIGNGTTVSGFGELLITNPDGVTVASIDEAGNATFSGELAADEVKTNEIVATKIYADEIISRSGKFGEIDIQNLESITREQIEEILRSAEQDQQLLLDTQDWNTNTATTSAVLASTIETSDLFVTGNTALTNLSISKSLAMGSDLVMTSEVEVETSLPKNTLNTLVSPLEIQSLALAPVEIMAGRFRIDTNGDVSIEGNLYVAGVVEAQGVKIKEKGIDGQSSEASPLLLSLQDKEGLDVANINASGSATFKQVEAAGLTIAGATTDTPVINELGEIQTNATAGKGILPSYNTEITIRNEKVNANTLVYITPTTTTENKVMYVKAKGDGFFTVGFSEFLSNDVEFNWWIVELKQ